ncbi:unnamed protein product [Clavelina lepadiformis]|uniref:Uncharacterized protein n=1 Tax=Clavelina lepadiformis TaxID=159417 RepID=A0ABP0GLI3_CLALP
MADALKHLAGRVSPEIRRLMNLFPGPVNSNPGFDRTKIKLMDDDAIIHAIADDRLLIYFGSTGRLIDAIISQTQRFIAE